MLRATILAATTLVAAMVVSITLTIALMLSVTGAEPKKPAPVMGGDPNCCYPV